MIATGPRPVSACPLRGVAGMVALVERRCSLPSTSLRAVGAHVRSLAPPLPARSHRVLPPPLGQVRTHAAAALCAPLAHAAYGSGTAGRVGGSLRPLGGVDDGADGDAAVADATLCAIACAALDALVEVCSRRPRK